MHAIPTLFSLLLVAGGTVGITQLGTSSHDPRDFGGQAQISLQDAIHKALAVRPGEAVEAELELEDRGGTIHVLYEVEIVAPDGLYGVSIHAQTGAILEHEKDDDRSAEEELEWYRQILRHSEKSLRDLVAAAESVVRGQAVSATMEVDDGHPICEVALTNDRYILGVALEARAGHAIEVEMLGGLDGWGEDDESEEEEEWLAEPMFLFDDNDEEDGEDDDEDEDDGKKERR